MISTQDQIKVMQAHVDGKPIECRAQNSPDDYWKEFTDEFQFDWNHGEYRIKPEAPPPPPEPREFWIKDDGKFRSGIKYQVWDYKGVQRANCIHVREVLE